MFLLNITICLNHFDSLLFRALCRTELDIERNICSVVVQRGNHLVSHGYASGSSTVLLPEEAIYLLDRGRIDIMHCDQRLSMQEATSLLCRGEIAMESLQVLFVVLSCLPRLIDRGWSSFELVQFLFVVELNVIFHSIFFVEYCRSLFSFDDSVMSFGASTIR